MDDYNIKADLKEYNTLNEKPFSSILLVSSSMVVGANALMVILAIIAVGFEGLSYDRVHHLGSSIEAFMVISIFFWLTVPTLVCTVSSFDLGKLVRGTLYPKRLVVSTACGLALWMLMIGLWVPCSLQGSWEYNLYWNVRSPAWDYCPNNQNLGKYPNTWVPFVGFAVIVCYCLQLALSILAFRHSREKLASIEAGQQQGLELAKRYKLASGVYTDYDAASDSLPSTFAGPIASPAPTAHPPSYVTRDPAGPAQSRAPSFYSEMSHWRRDVEVGSISGMSHMCTCQCHHGVAPQERIKEEDTIESRFAAVE